MYSGISTLGASLGTVPIGSVYSGISTLGASLGTVPIGSVYSGISTLGASLGILPTILGSISLVTFLNTKVKTLSPSTRVPGPKSSFVTRT